MVVQPIISTPADLSFLKDTSLLIPGPGSIGYLASLALDLLINTLKFERVATLNSPYIQQVVGSGVLENDELRVHTSMELFQSSTHPEWTILQIRSSYIQGHGISLSESLSSWIKQLEFKDVLIVTGLDSRRRNDKQLKSLSPLGYITSNDGSSEWISTLEKSSIGRLECDFDGDDEIIPPGGGMTRHLLKGLPQTPALALTFFSEEGDNFYSSQEFASVIYSLLGPQKKAPIWNVPPSWDSLYGSPINFNEIF